MVGKLQVTELLKVYSEVLRCVIQAILIIDLVISYKAAVTPELINSE